MNEERMPDPLPESWLPEPAREAGDEAAWENRVSRIVVAADPRLRELERRGAGAGPAPPRRADAWLDVARWWRPAIALAAAAALTLFLTRPAPPDTGGSPGSPALGAVVSEGEAASLWEAAGREAHPVLALIALEEETP